jgi:hypothetical protein
MVWRVLLVLLAVIVLTSCVTCAKVIREGVAMTMRACYAKCDTLPVGERPDCIRGCCTAICDDAPHTTQECKHYCGIETQQRHTLRQIQTDVQTYPDAEAQYPANHNSPTPPLADQRNTNWPVLYGPHGKENKSWYLPPNSKLIVPSVKEQLQWK